MYSSIVVGTDGSATAGAAVQHAIGLARQSGADLHIVSAIKVPDQAFVASEAGAFLGTAAGPEFEKEARDEMEAILTRSETEAREAGVKAKTHFWLGDPADALMGVAESTKADLIVVGNRGMKGVGRVLGSVPNKISHHSPCHLLIVHTT